MFIKVNLLVCYVFTQPIIVIVKKLNEKIEKKNEMIIDQMVLHLQIDKIF